MNCLRARQEMKAYIDGELRPWTRWLVTCHITSCAECRREMDVMNELTNDVRNASQVSAPDGLRDKVLRGITFQPAVRVQPTGLKVTLASGAAALLIIGVFAAVLFPTFSTSRGGSVAVKERLRQSPHLATEPLPASAPGGADVPQTSSAPATKHAGSSAPANLLIIKTADLSVQVRDFQKANDQAVSIAKSVGGYVTDTSAASDRGVPTSGSLSMRVPVSSFERTLNRLAKLGKVTSRSINGLDVTGESVDLESRLRNLRAEERQYLDIMNRAKRIPDVVTVTNELSRVRGEIEEAQGRLKFLKSAAAMSAINLSVSEKAKAQPPHKSSLGTTFGDAIASLGGTLNALASLAIWLAVYSPFWALPIVLWLYARKRAATAS